MKALQDFSFFLRGCCNAMEDVQYLHDLDMPSNMYYHKNVQTNSEIDGGARFVTYRKEKTRVKFKDVAEFHEKQVRILTDPVFGNIQDSAPVSGNIGMNKL